MPESSVAAILVLSLAAPYALVLAAPGPNLLVVLSAGLAPASRGPLLAAFGVACGATIAAATAALGASLVTADGPVRLVGGLIFAAILTRSGIRLLARAPAASDPAPPRRAAGGAFAAGFLVALSNPMTAPFFLSFFVSHPLARTEAGVALACATVFAMAGLWFAALGLLFSRTAVCGFAARRGAMLRRALGLAMLVVAAGTAARVALG